MLGVETVVFVGVCMFYLNFMVRDCIQGRRNRVRIVDTGWAIVDPEMIFIPTNHEAPFFRKIDIEDIAPLDPTEPKDNETCSICLDELKDVKYRRKTRCGHTFCSECIREWLHKKQICPMCNTTL